MQFLKSLKSRLCLGFFTALLGFIALFLVSPQSQGQISCSELFPDTAVVGDPRFLQPISMKSYDLAWLTSGLLVIGKNGHVDATSSAEQLKKILVNTPDVIVKSRASEMLRAIENAPNDRFLDARTLTKMWVIYVALDPANAVHKFANQMLSEDMSLGHIQTVARFIYAYDHGLARNLALQLVVKSKNARKLLRLFSPRNQGGPNEILAPQRAITFVLKILLNWPAELKQRIQKSNSLRFGDYDWLISTVTGFLREAGIENEMPTALQISSTFRVLQLYLADWSLQNPTEKASIIVKGSFVNGLAIRADSDIDIMISNQNLRSHFLAQMNSKIQSAVAKTLEMLGLRKGEMPLSEGISLLEGVLYFSELTARESGNLQTLAFEIFPDRIDVLIYDPEVSPDGRAVFESFKTE